jgi:hypothetical protein
MISVYLPSSAPGLTELFYTNYLSFQRKSAHGPVVWLQREPSFSLAIEAVEQKAEFPSSFALELQMESRREAEMVHQALLRDEIQISYPIRWQSDNHINFSTRDPDGRRVVIMWLAESTT